jgi:hypothetical protein
MILQCMGAFCGSREHCAHYNAPECKGIAPVERLCGAMEEPESMSAPGATPAAELHRKLADAHMTIVQAIKYPTTVAPSAVAKARKLISAQAVLDAQMTKPESRAHAVFSANKEPHHADREA